MVMICFMRTLNAIKTDIHVITMPSSALQHVLYTRQTGWLDRRRFTDPRWVERLIMHSHSAQSYSTCVKKKESSFSVALGRQDLHGYCNIAMRMIIRGGNPAGIEISIFKKWEENPK